jgi:hypothetical protein
MWRDEVLEEIYRIREEHAKAFNYDLKAICDDLRQRQAASGRQIISQPLKQPRQRHNNPVTPNLTKVIGTTQPEPSI